MIAEALVMLNGDYEEEASWRYNCNYNNHAHLLLFPHKGPNTFNHFSSYSLIYKINPLYIYPLKNYIYKTTATHVHIYKQTNET